MEDRLALHSGPKTVTLERSDSWLVINEEIRIKAFRKTIRPIEDLE